MKDLRFHYVLKIINVMFVYGVWSKKGTSPFHGKRSVGAADFRVAASMK